MKEITVFLTDQCAYAGYPFLHLIGERVRSRADDLEGIVKNAKYVGAELPGGSYEVTYDIQTDDGDIVHIPLIALEKVKAKQNQTNCSTVA